MSKNSTLKLWDYLLQEDLTLFDKSAHKTLSKVQLEPKKETIDTVLAYANSVKAIRTKLNDKILISLN